MLFHTILTLTHPTDTDAKKARIVEEIVTVAKVVFTKGMLILEDKEELEQEQEMWTARWDHRLVCGGALWINWELTGLQDMLQVSLQKARDHRMEPQVASHVVTKMEEGRPLCARWKTEVAVWCKEAVWKAEEAQCVKEEQQAAPSMLFKLTRLLGSQVALNKETGKGKAHALVHAPNVHMLVVQCKVSVRLAVPFFGLMTLNPVLSPVCGECHCHHCQSGRWSTHTRWIWCQCTCNQVQAVQEEQTGVCWTTQMNIQWIHKGKSKMQQVAGTDREEKGHKGGRYKGEGPRWVTSVVCIVQ